MVCNNTENLGTCTSLVPTPHKITFTKNGTILKTASRIREQVHRSLWQYRKCTWATDGGKDRETCKDQICTFLPRSVCTVPYQRSGLYIDSIPQPPFKFLHILNARISPIITLPASPSNYSSRCKPNACSSAALQFAVIVWAIEGRSTSLSSSSARRLTLTGAYFGLLLQDSTVLPTSLL